MQCCLLNEWGKKMCIKLEAGYKIFLVGSNHTLRQKKRRILYFQIDFNEIYLFIVSCWSGLKQNPPPS